MKHIFISKFAFVIITFVQTFFCSLDFNFLISLIKFFKIYFLPYILSLDMSKGLVIKAAKLPAAADNTIL